MDIQLETRLVLQLQEIAKKQNRDISALLIDAIGEYVERQTDETAFRTRVRSLITTHKWLLDELDKR
jgi:predicted transcriptional regulator